MVDKDELSKRITTAIKTVSDPTENDEFQFKTNADMNALKVQLSQSLSMMIGGDPKSTKCKGFRIYFVDESSGILMSEGMFVKDFSPEDWNDK